MTDHLTWLQNWYKSQCDGEWEHEYGIKIETLDNPGWAVKIDLKYTELEGGEIQYQLIEISENDWVGYSVKNDVFDGWGDSEELQKIISIFQEIVESKTK